MPHPKDGKKWIYHEKNTLKKSNTLKARQTLKILGETISSHIISFPFLSIAGHFQTTQESQKWLIRSRKTSCNRGKIFWIISKEGQVFRADQKKSLFRFTYW